MTAVPRLIAAAALGALLVACAAPAPVAPAAPAEADDPTIVALDDFAALNAMSLGVEPDLVLEVFEYATTAAVFDQEGVTTQPYGTELNLEQVIAAAPDVIIGMSIPTTIAVQADLERIAPTTVVDYTADWQEQLTTTARALGVPERADALRERIEADAATLSADLERAGLSGASVSVLGRRDATFSPPASTPVGTIIGDTGLARPSVQQQAGTPDSPFVTVSDETLLEHDAPTLYLLGGGQYSVDALTASPLWAQLAADSRTHEVSAETWLGSSAFSVDWVLQDLRATLLDGTAPARDTDAAARFRAFTGTT